MREFKERLRSWLRTTWQKGSQPSQGAPALVLPVGPEAKGPDNPPAQQEVSTSFSPKKYIIKECEIGESDNGRRMSANLENPF